jgi:hypothetical protein
MTANELRIGNYLNGKQGHVVVTEIKTNNSVKIHDNTSSFYVGICLMPIELTKEWLLKLGFEFTVDTWYLNGFALWETEWGDDKGATGIGYFYELRAKGMMDKHIKYVHQLQNLYFALTEKELIIKF